MLLFHGKHHHLDKTWSIDTRKLHSIDPETVSCVSILDPTMFACNTCTIVIVTCAVCGKTFHSEMDIKKHIKDVVPVARLEAFRALKLSKSESFRDLQFSRNVKVCQIWSMNLVRQNILHMYLKTCSNYFLFF